MPAYTTNSNIPYPVGVDPIRGTLTNSILQDLETLAKAADAGDVAARVGAVADTKAALQPRFDFTDKLAAEPGSWRLNSILDPEPLNAGSTYIANRANMTQAPGYGRAMCSAVGATYFIPMTDGLEGRAVPAKPGQPFAVSVQVRAMPTQDVHVTLLVNGHAASSGALGSGTQIMTTGRVAVEANVQRTLTLTGVVPAGTTTDLVAQVQFSRYNETYPAIGDFIYFRRFLLTVGSDPATPPSADYFMGDSPNSYWVGEPNKSPSITALPRKPGSGGSGSGGSSEQAFRRDTIVDAGIKRRGGKIGTNGLGAVALRFDHHLPNFKTKILPLLKTHRLPWGQMLNSSRIASGSETMTYAEIATECYNSGGEVWNHSYSHSDMPDEATANREVVQGFDDLVAGLPGLHIDGWAGPGQTDMMGMEGSEKPERFWGTYPGRLVMARHAFVRGYYPGIYQPMAGPNLIGAPHTTIDKQDAAYVSGIVRGAAASGSGATLMLHPNYLDTAGYMTTAQLGIILAEIAALRDAGDLLVLSLTGILLADASTAYRRNLLTTGAAGTGSWSETVNGRSAQSQYGVPHELVVTVRAKSTGRVMLNLKETGTPRFDALHSRDIAAGASVTLRCLVTPPLDCTGMVAQLTGDVDYSAIRLHAV